MTLTFKNGFLCGQCSTSCGLGAVWRTLTCSTGSESNCDPTKKPAPARQCYLRPCSMWKLGEWSMVRLLVNICMFYMIRQYMECWCLTVCYLTGALLELNSDKNLFGTAQQTWMHQTHGCLQASLDPAVHLKVMLHLFSQCSKNCEGGIKFREVQCFDLRDERPLRPFHCRAMSSRPPTQKPCNVRPCLDWYTSSWGQVSEII